MSHPLIRCGKCGVRLPAGTPEELCPFCVPEEPSGGEPAGRILGECELFEEIGRGGMGVVWRGRQCGLNRSVAVKTLPGGDLAGAGARARFRTEAQAAARLHHPNIVSVYGVGEAEGMPYLIMELVEGPTLAAVLAEKTVPARQAAQWLRETALAVEHAHGNGVLHRDLKPSNILIEPDPDGGRPRVTDFGLARLMDEAGGQTRTAAAAGTPSYMAPEQARGGAGEAAADIYSLGAVLYTVLTGRPPFRGESMVVLLHQVEQEEPLPPRRLNSSLPRDLETVCLKCLEKNPLRRYASALALAQDLTRFLEGRPVSARPAGAAEKLWRLARRRPWHAAAALLGAALLGGVIFSLAWSNRQERRHQDELRMEQAATRLALRKARLGEARAIVRLRQADSRPRAMDVIRGVMEGSPPDEIRHQARIIAASALSLPSAHPLPLSGPGAVTDDWTMAAGDLARQRWALADYRGQVVLRQVEGAANLSTFNTAPRTVTALIGFSPGGRWLAIRHREELAVWDTGPDAPEGPVFAARPWGDGRAFGFMKTAFAPDDASLLWQDQTDVALTALPGGEVHTRWAAPEGGELRTDCLAIDPAGHWAALALAGRPAVELRHFPEGSVAQTFTGLFHRPLTGIALSRDAARLAGGDAAGGITVWMRDGGAESVLQFQGHREAIRALAFSPDGRFLASTGEDGSLRVWDCVTGGETYTLAFDAGAVTFSADGNRIGVGYAGGRLVWAQLSPSDCFYRFRPALPPEGAQMLSFFPDSRSLACLARGGALRCGLPHGEVLDSFDFPRPYAVLAEPDGGGVLISGPAGVVRYAVPSGHPPEELFPSSRWGWDGLTSSAGGQWVAASDNGNSRAAFWPAGSADPAQARFLSSGENAGSGMVALAPDGELAAVAFRYDPGLRIFDTASGTVRHRLDLPPRHSLAWSPDGRWLAGSGTTMPLWDTATWRQAALPGLPPANHPPAGAVAFSWPQDGASRLLAAAAGDSGMALLRLPDGALLTLLEPTDPGLYYKAEFSRDHQWLAAAAAGGEIHLWHLPALRRRLAALGLDWE